MREHNSANIILTDLLKFIWKSAHMVFKRKTQFLSQSKRNSPSWWDNECITLSKQRKPALKNYKNDMNLSNFIKYKKAEAKSKRLFEQKWKESWMQFCNSLHLYSNPSQIWEIQISRENWSLKNIFYLQKKNIITSTFFFCKR